MSKNLGFQTIYFDRGPSIIATASVVGQKEGEGPLASYFDEIERDEYFGEASWEKAESELCRRVIMRIIEKAGADMDFVLGGDLLNQCGGAHYGMRALDAPFLGLYGACSTMAESLTVGAALIDGGFAKKVLCATGSHFCASEKQFRQPLEYGGQRPPTSQWTVTGGGAVMLCENAEPPFITHATVGRIIDKKVTDANNMGAAMAPAFADTIKAHFAATKRNPDYYDMIVSGDLGSIGSRLADELLLEEGIDISARHKDCGCMIFDAKAQDAHAGGSGCGCSASVLCGYLFDMLKSGNVNKILFVATGALMNPTATLQGESIPSIAHAVAIEN